MESSTLCKPFKLHHATFLYLLTIHVVTQSWHVCRPALSFGKTTPGTTCRLVYLWWYVYRVALLHRDRG